MLLVGQLEYTYCTQNVVNSQHLCLWWVGGLVIKCTILTCIIRYFAKIQK